MWGEGRCSMAGEGSELSFRLANLEASRTGGERCLGRRLHEFGIQERPEKKIHEPALSQRQ